MSDIVVVTRHPALVQYLREIGVIDAEDAVNVVTHATPEGVRGRHVVGVLPIHLAALTAKYTAVPIWAPQELRGVELTVEQVRQYAKPAQTFIVTEV